MYHTRRESAKHQRFGSGVSLIDLQRVADKERGREGEREKGGVRRFYKSKAREKEREREITTGAVKKRRRRKKREGKRVSGDWKKKKKRRIVFCAEAWP